jgi:hypothetical protein
MISFIVPAHNEETWVGRCVSAIRSAMEFVGGLNEVIVVDDASTDATGRSPSSKERTLSEWNTGRFLPLAMLARGRHTVIFCFSWTPIR